MSSVEDVTAKYPSLSRFFITHPRFAWVVSIVITLIGAISLMRLAVAEYPNVTPVTITVTANYTGASAKVLNDSVAQVLEDQINGVEDIWYYKCYCVFRPGVQSNIALVNVQNAVKRAEPKLPLEVTQSGITVKKRPEDRMVMYMFMTDGREIDMMGLSNFVEKQVADAISRMDGVALVETGGRTYSMRIWLDPIRLAGLNISIAEIKSAIESQNIQAAAGTIGGEYANKYLTFKLNVKGRLATKEEFEDIIVRTNPETGAQVRVKDIARVELGCRGYTVRTRFNENPAVSLSVYKTPEANAVATAERVKVEIDKWIKRMPPGVVGVLADDSTAFTKVFLKETFVTLIVALLLVVAITYLFMQDVRATFVPAIAIPVSLVGTFAFMYMLGFTINVLTMFGLILVIGSLVDDAIVVVENTQALMEREGLSAKEAAAKSMSQITGAIIATTLVTLACYLPLAFYGGMVGMMYVQFAVTMCVSLCLSTVVAIVLSPVLCAYLLKKPDPNRRRILLAPFNWTLETSRKTYLKFVGVFVRRAILTLLLFAGCVTALWYFTGKVPTAFLPKEDRGYIGLNIRLSEGQSMERIIAGPERKGRVMDDKTKRTIMTEVAAVLAFSAASNNDKVGCLLFSEGIEKFIPPKKGRSHILQIIRTLLDYEPQGKATSLTEPVKYLTNALKKRCTTFLISDFCLGGAADEVYAELEKSLKIASGKHDIVGIRVYDQLDAELPDVGLMEVVDAESGRREWVDTSSRAVREHYATTWRNDHERINRILDRARVDHADVATDQDYVKELIKLFSRR